MADNTNRGAETLRNAVQAANGFLPFDQFMRLALYDPACGYYTCNIRSVGEDGDFSTAATLSPLLARAIAHWAGERRREWKLGFRWHLIEVGAGNGLLAKAILRELSWRDRLGCRLHVVETSPRLRQLQMEQIGAATGRWHESLEEALAEAGGKALIVSNEVMDAFPPVALIHEEGEWRELGVCLEAGQVVECSRLPRSTQAEEARVELGRRAIPEREGARVEVPVSIRHWLGEWADCLKVGSVLTIDYGGLDEELARQAPFGSLRAYFQHQALEGDEVYRRVGWQDITYDVNFSLLGKWAQEQGFRTVGLDSQHDFIVTRARCGMNLSDRDQMIIDQSGAGLAFKVAEWVKGE